MIGKTRDVWEPLEDELALPYACFKVYLEQRPKRSIAAVSPEVNLSTRHLKRFSRKWDWVRRAKAYDQWIEHQYWQAARDETRKTAETWAQREAEQREQKWKKSEKLSAQAERMLDHPLVETKRVTQTDEQGHPVQVQLIIPTNWTKRDAAEYLALADKLAREAIRDAGAEFKINEERDTYTFKDYPSGADQPSGGSRPPRGRRSRGPRVSSP